jgi:hypothetical protein
MATLVSFDIALAAHEGTRLAAVLEAVGAGWDPGEVYAGEAEARRLLYSNLDSYQQAHYDLLVAAGVLPETGEWSR